MKYLMTRQNPDFYLLSQASFKIKRRSSGLVIWLYRSSWAILAFRIVFPMDCDRPILLSFIVIVPTSVIVLFLSTLQRTVKRALGAYQSLLFHNKETIAMLEELSKEN